MTPHHTPRPRTPAEVQATIIGHKKQIRHFQDRIAEADARILALQGQTTLPEAIA